jgi:hypothetical protein
MFLVQIIESTAMNRFQKNFQADLSGRSQMVSMPPGHITINLKSISLVFFLILASNILTLLITHRLPFAGAGDQQLYLMDKAKIFVQNGKEFDSKVREVSRDLGIKPEWLMAVIYAESKFDASVSNHRGSGAVGLIQWMPATAKELNVSLERLRTMNHVEQMDYVYRYLDLVRSRYGSFDSLTDLYLAILYPKAIRQDPCYTLYADPEKAYKQNVGLDEDRDGRVTVNDIDKRMRRMYPEAYFSEG